MHCHTVFTLGIEDYYLLPVGIPHHPTVADLAAHFTIEGGAVEYYLEEFLVFLFNLAVAKNLRFGFGAVITNECGFSLTDCDPVGCLDSSRITGTGLLGSHLLVKPGLVKGHAVFFQDKPGKVEGETVGVVKCECFRTGNFRFSIFPGSGNCIFQHTDTVFKSAQE